MSTSDSQAGESQKPRRPASFWRAPIRFLFGYDVFISYGRSDADAYAELLETKLAAAGYATFRDKQEIDTGDRLDSTLRKAIKRSRQFVLIDSPGARQSPWVAGEIKSLFQSDKARLTRIRFDGVSSDGSWPSLEDQALNQRMEGFVWATDTAEALASGRPSEAIIEQVTKTFRTVRLRNVMRFSVACVIASLSGLLIWSVRQTMVARHQAQIATVRELVALSLVNQRSDPELSVLLALQAISASSFSPGDTVLSEAEGQLHRALLASHVRLAIRDSEGIQAVSWSSDGKRLATGTEKGKLKIWDADYGKDATILNGHALTITSVAWSPDGNRLATGSEDQLVKIWDGASGRELRTLTGSKVRVNSVAWSPDGKRLAAGSWYGTVKVWDVETGNESQTLTAGVSYVTSVAWNVDGTRLALGTGGGEVSVWDIIRGKEVLPLEGHGGSVWGASWSPDGKRLATASRDGTAKVWDTEKGKELLTLRGHAFYLTSVAWSPDGGRLATGSRDQTAKVWDANTGDELLTLSGHSGYVMSVAWSPNSERLATASLDHTLRVWDAGSGHELPTLKGHRDRVTSVTWSADGKRLWTTSGSDVARIWDAATGKELPSLDEEVVWVERNKDPCRSPDGKMEVTADRDAGVVKVEDPNRKQSLTLTIASVTSCGWSPDSKILATGTWDGATVLWDPKTGRELGTLSRHSSLVRELAWSPNGSRLATASADGTSKVWDAASGVEMMTLDNHTGDIFSVAWSPDGNRLATASDDTTVQIYAMDLHDLAALASQRVTRGLTQEECHTYLRLAKCPPLPSVSVVK